MKNFPSSVNRKPGSGKLFFQVLVYPLIKPVSVLENTLVMHLEVELEVHF